jgi:formylglycine-generating enzyme required for sulfatase activity
MKSIMKIMPARALCAFCLVVPFGALAQTAPVVQQSSVTAAQAYPSKDVNISYTISDAVSTSDNVWIIVSSDGGTTWTVPASSFSGAQGLGVPVTSAPTVQNVTWHAGTDWNGNYTTTCRVRVIACNNNMVLIPAGSYLRGNPPALGDSDITDAPQYSVNVNAFLMDNNYVSGYLWTNVLGYASSHGYTFDNAGSFNGQSYPVTSVNWYDAVKWCNARSQYEGVPPVYYTDAGFTTLYTSGGDVDAIYVKPGVNGYRLPTEAEWEKAARGGLSGFRFPWGNTISESQANYYGCISVCGFTYDLGPNGYSPAGFGGQGTSPVGSFPANGYSLYDMAGNVYAWCWDWYGSSYYASGQTNPQGPSNNSFGRVLRGGSWDGGAYYARCAYRSNYSPFYALHGDGFRCVRGF